jgi:methyl-accepting chemotaxis protein
MLKTLSTQFYSKYLWIIVTIIMVPFLLITAIQVYDVYTAIEKERRNDMRHNVQIVMGVLTELNIQETEKKITKEQAQNLARGIIKTTRFNSDGYFWVIDTHGSMVQHPVTPELNGKDLLKNSDPNSARIWVESINTVKNQGEGFITYKWSKPGSSIKTDKTSFVRLFEPWGWVIGTGTYHDDISIMIKESIHNNIFIGVITLLLSLIIVSCILHKSEVYFYEKFMKN